MTVTAILHTIFISQKGSTSVSSSEVNMAEATPVTGTAILQDLPLQSTTMDLFLRQKSGQNKIFISQKSNSSVSSSEVNMAEAIL